MVQFDEAAAELGALAEEALPALGVVAVALLAPELGPGVAAGSGPGHFAGAAALAALGPPGPGGPLTIDGVTILEAIIRTIKE